MTDAIQFILNGKRTEVRDLPATTTLLQYLRLHAGLTGTKEGCAEGDCGACTALVGKLEGDEVRYQAINACIAFLPTLDGRQVITVEHLAQDGALHPVQEAMVACHASQCGFCTPGFVVSLAGLLDKRRAVRAEPDEDAIHDAIAGNLCRCTGYRPIVDAAKRAELATRDAPQARALPSDAAGLRALQRTSRFSYRAGESRYFAPVTSAELATTLAEHPDATMLAGGTDVGLWVTKHHRELSTVIYTGNVRELSELGHDDAGNLVIGAAVSYTDAFEALSAFDPSMRVMLKRLGSVQIRNAGTVGGNIANGSPIGDGMPPLIALGARITLRSTKGARELPLENYFLAYQKQDREKDEFVEKVIVPKPAPGTFFKTYKISKRFDQDISAVCFALSFTRSGEMLKNVRLAYGGMAATPKRAAHAEKVLEGARLDDATLAKAKAALDRDFTPLSDMRASKAYRGEVAKNLLERAFIEATSPETLTQVYCHGR